MDLRYGILQEGRFKAVQLSTQLLINMLKDEGVHPGYRVINDGLPGDARIVNIYIDYINFRRYIFMVVESETYDLIPPGRMIPLLEPKIEVVLPLSDGNK